MFSPGPFPGKVPGGHSLWLQNPPYSPCVNSLRSYCKNPPTSLSHFPPGFSWYEAEEQRFDRMSGPEGKEQKNITGQPSKRTWDPPPRHQVTSSLMGRDPGLSSTEGSEAGPSTRPPLHHFPLPSSNLRTTPARNRGQTPGTQQREAQGLRTSEPHVTSDVFQHETISLKETSQHQREWSGDNYYSLREKKQN